MIKNYFLTVLLGLWILMSCSGNLDPFKVLYVNSYHPGYPSSDDITEGIKSTLQQPGIRLKTLYMDTKRNQDEAFIQSKALEILDEMNDYDPDVLIVSDDNAVKYLIVPHLLEHEIPIVFCGVNWSAESYGLPRDHITGMLEVLPVEKSMRIVREMNPDISRVVILSENSLSEQKNTGFITPILEKMNLNVKYQLAGTFDEWKSFFNLANEEADVIYMPTNGAIRNWDQEEAIRFIRGNLKIPLITCDDFMMPYAVLGVTKVQSEQGIWAGETALKIRKGIKVSSIGITENSQVKIWWNPELAEVIHLNPEQNLLQEAIIYRY